MLFENDQEQLMSWLIQSSTPYPHSDRALYTQSLGNTGTVLRPYSRSTPTRPHPRLPIEMSSRLYEQGSSAGLANYLLRRLAQSCQTPSESWAHLAADATEHTAP